MDDVKEVSGDGVEEPRDDNTVHTSPGRVGEGRIAEDMVLQGEAAEGEEEVAAPLRVVGGLEIQSDRNKVPDVLDGGGLTVKTGDGRGVGGEGRVVLVSVRVVVARSGGTGTAPEGGGPLLQDICLRALPVEGICGSADPILGGGGGFKELGVLQELVAALGVGGA
jgi:hypothetical protein